MTKPGIARARFTQAREIELVCDERSHATLTIGRFASSRFTLSEVWDLTGPHVTRQQIRVEGDNWETLALLDRVAIRTRARCPQCGLDVVAGDRFGSRPGARSLMAEPDETARAGAIYGVGADAALSLLADKGQRIVTLSGWGYILSL